MVITGPVVTGIAESCGAVDLPPENESSCRVRLELGKGGYECPFVEIRKTGSTYPTVSDT